MEHWKRRLFKLTLVVTSSLVAVLFIELTMRCYIFGSHAFSYTSMRSLHSLGSSGLIRAAEHQEILYELLPELNTRYKLCEFRTNSDGLRDREYSRARAPGTFRVAVLGDSLTMGSGVSIEETYHSMLEQQLTAESADSTYEFINFGVSGYYLSQYLGTIRHKVLDYSPDLILIGFYAGNDSRVPNAEKFGRPYRVKETKNGFYKMHGFSLLGDIWKYSIVPRFKGEKTSAGLSEEVAREQRAYVDETFGKIAAVADGIPVLIAFLNNAPTDPADVATLAAKHGFAFIDTTGAFAGANVLDHSIYLTDKHPNGKANRIFADVIHDALSGSPLLDPTAPDGDAAQ